MAKSIFSVSIDSGLAELFDREDNKSALVESLLLKHYEKNKAPENLEQEIKEKKELLDKKEQEKEIIAKKQLEEAAKEERKIKNKINFVKSLFKEDLGRDITEEELTNYLELEAAGLTNYADFMGSLKNGVK